ncbi:Unannotated [Lentimonas sp. CC19]|uniref:REP-associated tyrosine transposase n=2 Tax=Lentimonas TaxID=417293 RepID=UPI0013205A0D|nr:Unannotated [Lentimonas sp. CC10]CAA6692026.1 Unannotated [Lentimonas sp. CC19]CAA7070524.1 Unannotated [Lentimonas sp. CC11]
MLNKYKMSRLYHNPETNLRRGRYSTPGGRYFITICTKPRKPGLTQNPIGQSIIEALREIQRAQQINLHCATIMPDHVHLLYTLGNTLTLSQVQAKLKTFTNQALATAELHWQSNYFDHHLRHDASLEKFAYYIFLNPYKKHLIEVNESWPWWTLNRSYRPEFSLSLKDGQFPQPEWLQESEECNLKAIIESDC